MVKSDFYFSFLVELLLLNCCCPLQIVALGEEASLLIYMVIIFFFLARFRIHQTIYQKQIETNMVRILVTLSYSFLVPFSLKEWFAIAIRTAFKMHIIPKREGEGVKKRRIVKADP